MLVKNGEINPFYLCEFSNIMLRFIIFIKIKQALGSFSCFTEPLSLRDNRADL